MSSFRQLAEVRGRTARFFSGCPQEPQPSPVVYLDAYRERGQGEDISLFLFLFLFLLSSPLHLPMLHPIIFGSSGMVGRGVLLECLDSPEVGSVTIINRRPSGESHPKLKEIVLSDVGDISSVRDQLRDVNACFFCLGISAIGLSEEEYTRTTYDITLRAAQTLQQINPDLTFIYVSGEGTDANGKMMWARVKGKTENAVMALFPKGYAFRPGAIIPLRGIKSRTRLYNILLTIFRPFFPLFRRSPNVTDTSRIGWAMIQIARSGFPKKILVPRNINEAAQAYAESAHR